MVSSKEKPRVRTKNIKAIREAFRKEWGEDIWDRAYTAACEELGIDKEEPMKTKWHSMELEVLFTKKLHEQNPELDENHNLVFNVGLKGAKEAFSTAYRFLRKVVSLENIIKTSNMGWSQYFTKGSLLVEKEGDNYTATLKNIELEHPYDYYLCGYFVQVGRTMGGDVRKAKHSHLIWEGGETKVTEDKLTKCTAEGDEEAVFLFKIVDK